MSKIIDIPLSVEGLGIISKDINKMIRLLDNDKLMAFFKDKILQALKLISIRRINSIDNQEDASLSTYLAGNNAEIKGEIIYVYNDSVIDIKPSKFADQNKIKNYPLQLSLAKIVEYGIGDAGKSTKDVGENWEYDVNEHGVEGWYYKDNSGQFHWTNGFQGKLIFHNLDLYVQENASKWFEEYLKSNGG